jgi:creatinine amidohydrolase
VERRLLYLNHVELRKVVPEEIDTVIVPVGTVEAHGVTPLGTDVIIPEAMAERVAPEINALIAPAVPYGITRGLLGHPGTIHIQPEVFEDYVYDLLESLAKVGFTKIVVLNGHGGQTTELKNVLFETSRQTGAKTLLIDWWHDADRIRQEILGREGGHAGADETACIVAIDPSMAKPDLFDLDSAALYSEAYTAYPVPGSIIVYRAGDWSLTFDRDKCSAYFDAVTAKVTDLIKDILAKWSLI